MGVGGERGGGTRAALSGAGRPCASVRHRRVNVSAARGRPFPAPLPRPRPTGPREPWPGGRRGVGGRGGRVRVGGIDWELPGKGSARGPPSALGCWTPAVGETCAHRVFARRYLAPGSRQVGVEQAPHVRTLCGTEPWGAAAGRPPPQACSLPAAPCPPGWQLPSSAVPAPRCPSVSSLRSAFAPSRLSPSSLASRLSCFSLRPLSCICLDLWVHPPGLCPGCPGFELRFWGPGMGFQAGSHGGAELGSSSLGDLSRPLASGGGTAGYRWLPVPQDTRRSVWPFPAFPGSQWNLS